MKLHLEILATGDELLSGQLVDTNSPWLMDRLFELGLLTRRKTLVGDDREDLAAAIRETTGRADVVVLSGGMGPTEDDLTSETVAAVLGVPLELHEPSLRAIEERFRRFHRPMTPNNAKQARFPRGAEIIPNPYGTAPGFAVRVGRAELVCFPGVPSEYKGLCQDWLLPRLAARLSDVPAAGMVKLFGVGESNADHVMRPVMDDAENAGVRFGYRAHFPEVHVKWIVPGPDAAAREARLRARVRALFGEQAFGEDRDELPAVVVAALAARGERVALAESCTGGMVAEMLTDVAGSSAVLDLGVVAYANAMKERLLGVDGAVLAAHGAVSEPVARALAEGARALAGATWGLGVTGVAGPGGGTEEKPVGTVHLAIAGPDGTRAWARRFPGDRERVRKTAAYDVLNQLRLLLR